MSSFRQSAAKWLNSLMGADPRANAQQVALDRLLWLRWIAFAVQSGLALLVWATSFAELAFGWIASLLLCIAVSNLLVRRLTREPSPQVIAFTILLDVMILTGLLYFSGGPANPFSILYLIQVMLAALMTSPAWIWVIVSVSSLGYAALFWKSVALPAALGGGHHHHHGSGSFSFHLQGMWIAYTISAILIAWFVSKLAQSLRRAHEQQDNSRRLLSLAALAAGAAHEIGNPLATIYIAAGELERGLSETGAKPSLLSDARLISDEVGRAKQVLDRMAAGAGEMRGEGLIATTLDQVLEATLNELDQRAQRVECSLPDAVVQVQWPIQAVSQALSQLLRNAIEASPASQRVEVGAETGHSGVSIHVCDRGSGMSKELLERVGEPFFTTRSERGMGLGVFIARSLIEQLGGTLIYKSKEGQGTTAQVWLPFRVL